MGTELTEAEAFENALAAFDDMDLEQYSGAGNENVTANDITIPYLNILQKMSPQCDEDSPDYVEGAKAGQFFQNVNKLRWERGEELEIVPVAYERKVLEWKPRESGGGLVAMHPMSALQEVPTTTNDKGIPIRDDNGNLLIDTAVHYVMYRNTVMERWEPALISMKSTNHKKSRLWNSLIAQQTLPNGKQAPRWLFIWKATTVLESKDDNTWYNWEFARGGMVDVDLFKRCEKLYKAHKAGQVSGAEGGEGADEIPF